MARAALTPLAVLLALLLAALPAPAQVVPSLEDVMSRVAAYLLAYAEDYSATIASEHYEQTAERQFTVLDSDFGILRLPGGSQWLGFRDVLRVDGSPVADRETRLADLFANASAVTGFSRTTAAQAARIVRESARFNIGSVQRTINNPALVLELLDPRHHPGFRFSKAGEENVGAVRAWKIRFTERARPTVIGTSSNRDVPAIGDVWIDPSTGRLLRADVVIRIGGARNSRIFQGTVRLTFRDIPELQLWLPDKMTERYEEVPGSVLQAGEATYTNYRRFRVESQENIALPKSIP